MTAHCGSRGARCGRIFRLFDFHTRMRVHPSSGGKGAVWSDWNGIDAPKRTPHTRSIHAKVLTRRGSGDAVLTNGITARTAPFHTLTAVF